MTKTEYYLSKIWPFSSMAASAYEDGIDDGRYFRFGDRPSYFPPRFFKSVYDQGWEESSGGGHRVTSLSSTFV